MGDCDITVSNHEMQHHIAAAAQHILMALKACKTLTDDTKKALSDLTSYTSILDERGDGLLMDMEEQIGQSEKVIMKWESSPEMIWDSGLIEASKYLHAVDQLQKIVGAIGGLPMPSYGKQRELSLRAEGILQLAMSKLEEELTHILVEHKQCYEPEYMSFRSCVEDVVYDESFVSTEDEPAEPASRVNNSGSSSSEQCLVDLLQPEVISAVKSIARMMLDSKHDKEFCQAFVDVRKDALEEYLVILEMEEPSIEDTLKMDWKALSCEMKKWVWALRIIVRVYLGSERRLCNQILADFGSAHLSRCFVKITEGAMLRFLNVGEAIAMGTRQPERLFRVLDMYEGLADVLLDIDGLFMEDVGSFIRTEFNGLLARLGDYAKAAFAEFRNCIVSDRPKKSFSSGVHPLTNYAMNYIKTLCDYRETLDLLLCDQEADGLDPPPRPENDERTSSYTACPLGRHARLVATLLEANLESRSKLLKDEALQHIFLMNNVHYMVQKIITSDLRQYVGDEWIRRQIGNYQHHATDYIRATWSLALPLLRNQDRHDLMNPFCRPSQREKCRRFVAAFEDVYKSQTGWVVPDPQLRDDLQISTSLKVIQAYRSFLGNNSAQIGEKYIKYSADDLGDLVLDFFSGYSRPLRSFRRR